MKIGTINSLARNYTFYTLFINNNYTQQVSLIQINKHKEKQRRRYHSDMQPATRLPHKTP